LRVKRRSCCSGARPWRVGEGGSDDGAPDDGDDDAEDAMRLSLQRSIPLAVAVALAAGFAAAAAPPRHLVDPRDGRSYRTVEIGGLTWLAENLAWAALGSFCYGDDEENCERYGRLYRWEQALAACPPGTHLASELEWQALERTVGLPEVEIEQRQNRGTVEGARLKPGGDTGFDVQYGGWRRYEDGSYSALGENVAYWTSTEVDLAHAQHRDLDVGDDMIWRSPVVKHYALSVRCVVDRYVEDEYPGDDTHPVFSPDGRQLAYISNREGVAVDRPINFEVYVLDLATKRERRLTFNDAFEADLAWSPDGTRLAFKSYRDGNDEVYLMGADGSDQVNLTGHPASDGGPAFTPDGAWLLFASDRDGDRDLYRMRPDGSGVERLTDHPRGEHSPSLSPDGRRVAFVSDRDGNDEVYVMALDGSAPTRVTDAPLADWSPVWSADGGSLLVTYGDWETDAFDLVLVDLASGERRTVLEGSDSGNASWRARDGVLAFGAATRRRETDTRGPGRIHLTLPGGAGPQPLTGRLAGVFGGNER
jgi:TolB protein